MKTRDSLTFSRPEYQLFTSDWFLVFIYHGFDTVGGSSFTFVTVLAVIFHTTASKCDSYRPIKTFQEVFLSTDSVTVITISSKIQRTDWWSCNDNVLRGRHHTTVPTVTSRLSNCWGIHPAGLIVWRLHYNYQTPLTTDRTQSNKDTFQRSVRFNSFSRLSQCRSWSSSS